MLKIQPARRGDPGWAGLLCCALAVFLAVTAINALDPNWHDTASRYGRLLSHFPPLVRTPLLCLVAAFMGWLGIRAFRLARDDNKIFLTPEKIRALTLFGWREVRWLDVENIEYGGISTPLIAIHSTKSDLATSIFLKRPLLICTNAASHDAIIKYIALYRPDVLTNVDKDPTKMSKFFHQRLALIQRYSRPKRPSSKR